MEKWEGVVSKGNQDVAKYEGDIRNGKPNGQGIKTYPDGGKYVGEWKDGIPIQGTMIHPNGDKYVGELKDGLMNGQGTYTYPHGRKNVGKWKNGKLWNGRYFDKNGKIIQRVVNGKKTIKQ